ncbi:MAG: metallophosphoesterase, partial [Ruminiclostridium sp.]|nr:metallophosphoesterase [Ruminiclostridium sp.]
MILVTGDVHGDLSRFSDKHIKRLKKNDFLLICGDLGLIWDGSEKEKKLLKKLGKHKYNI